VFIFVNIEPCSVMSVIPDAVAGGGDGSTIDGKDSRSTKSKSTLESLYIQRKHKNMVNFKTDTNKSIKKYNYILSNLR